MLKYTLMNMCMIYDAATNRVLIQDKINSKWSGITFPGGHVEDAESIYESTIREVMEETGLTISSLEQVGMIHMCNPANQERRLIFLYKTSHYKGELINETNEGRVYWVSKQELENIQLAANMREYLKVFLDSGVFEAYVTPNANGESDFRFFPTNEHNF